PELVVGMSTHNIEMVKQCHEWQLDYVFFGHIFPTSSHPDEHPRTIQEIHDVLEIDIPIYAIGGISPSTISQLPTAFDGLCSISFFMTSTVSEINSLKRKWHAHA
ncbi:thiamine phosphate synthase, partial [Rhodococcus fascians]|nr:thiamine phosphate synthase [Rhodococcus fascians]